MNTRAPEEPYTLSFSAAVESIDERTVTLEETYFYAESGGQPADRGTIADVDVIDVQHEDGQVVHTLADEPSFETGEIVEGLVNSTFRRYCMRAHTASHALYGAGRQLLEDLGYGGFDISAPTDSNRPSADGKVRVDFSTPTDIDDDTLLELERLTNEVIWKSRDVHWETLSREEALGRDDIAFNTKTEEGVTGETVRVVTIEDWDVAACGGTHVRNTREIGPVTVLDRSNPGEGLTRVEFAVGYRAISQRITDRDHALTAAKTLETGIEELPDAVARLQSESQQLQSELDELRAKVVDSRLEKLREDTVTKDGETWLVGTVTGLGANALADRAQELVGDETAVVALVGENGEYLAVATNGASDAGEIVERVTDEFGGGGGGGPTLAQAGGLDGAGEEIVSFLRT